MAILGLMWYQSLIALLAPAVVYTQSSKASPSSAATASVKPQFTVPASAGVGATLLPNIYDPEALVAQDVCPGYVASNVQTSSIGLTALLTLASSACNAYGTDITNLTLTVEYQTDSRLRVNIQPSQITAQNESWYVLPTSDVPSGEQGNGQMSTGDLIFSWSHSQNSGFGFNVTRRSTGEALFSTTGTKLVFENQFIELVTNQPENYNLYGLGEVIHEFRLGTNFTRTIYAADVGDPIDRNLYGSHPFYLQTRYHEAGKDESSTSATSGWTSDTNGVYFRNSHGMEVLLNPTNVTWRTLGGSIDLYFFAGPTQPEVTRQYLDVIGYPVLQQYWGFGFHQCRWGYANWSETESIVNAYEEANIPLEVIWNDIDYMKSYRDFDNDPVRFSYSEGQEFLQRLHNSGRHYVPIVDAAIYIPNPENASDAYQTYDTGNASDAFLLNPDGSVYIGAVWPGYTVFPDWLKPSTAEWWKNEVMKYYGNVPIDGIWIDMNEISSFCVGSCGTGDLTLNPVHPPFGLGGEPGNIIYDYPEGFNLTNATEAASASASSSAQAAAASRTASSSTVSSSTSTSYLRTTPTPGVRDINYPPYVINHVQEGHDLAVHAVSPNATHHNGVVEYDVHNIYGHQLLEATYESLLQAIPGKRPFIIGRSTFPGSGNYSGHWGGDNASKFYYMYFSIPQALSFSLFGIPMFGVDTCGFNGNTDLELCSRWMQLSAFFPFYRNHNTLSALPQEAYRWSAVASASRTAMSIRYQLLPYFYTLFYHAHTRGDTVMRALAWEFPNDPSLASADRQFFLGPSILVTPVLIQGVESVNGVFPGLVEGTDKYYDWYNRSSIAVPTTKNTTIAAPLGHIPVYIRGGSVLAMQQSALTTRDARKTEWSIIAAAGVDGKASGDLYLDDGESLVQDATKFVTFSLDGLRLDAAVDGQYGGLDLPLANVTFLGVSAAPSSAAKVLVNGGEVQGARSTYDATSQSLVVSGLEGINNGKAWSYGWSLEIA